MAVLRDQPYNRFNFLVDLGDGNSDGPSAGFAEIGALAMRVDVTEYRNGNSRVPEPMKITGLAHVLDVTLRRGLIGSLALYQWMEQVRNGDPNALRTVTIRLQNEDRSAVVQMWKLRRARIVRYASGPLDALGGALAMEEMVLAYEGLEIE